MASIATTASIVIEFRLFTMSFIFTASNIFIWFSLFILQLDKATQPRVACHVSFCELIAVRAFLAPDPE